MDRWFRVYPLLLSIWSPLDLAASNRGEWVRFSDLEQPLLISAGASVAIWIAAALLTRDRNKRSFLAFLGVLAFIGGGSFIGLFRGLLSTVGLDPIAPAFLLFGVVAVCAIVGTVGSRRSFASLSRFLGYASALLLTFAIVRLVVGQRGRTVMAHAATPVPAAVTATDSTRPSIYLIVLDKYQGSSTLRSYYGFDNSPFERALRDRGFILPLRPRANYIHTRQAMSALLNWSYLDSLVGLVGEDATDLVPLLDRIENNRAMAFLKGLGYEVIFFPNPYEPFRENRHADLQLPDPQVIRPELETVWLHSTIVPSVALAVCRVTGCAHVPGLAESPVLTDWKFDRLGNLPPSTRPRFVLAHLLVPHEPYVYQADCRHAQSSLLMTDRARVATAYLDQITCVNQKVLAAVDAILRRETIPPVILLQSDHGHGHVASDDVELADVRAATVRARVDILSAYYVPGAADTLFYEGMSPVNLLPRVFNHLFGTTFPRLPDRSHWVYGKRPYRLPLVPADMLD